MGIYKIVDERIIREPVKALARFLFGGEERIVRFNKADFNNPWTAVDRMFCNPHINTELERLGMLSARLARQTFAVLLEVLPDVLLLGGAAHDVKVEHRRLREVGVLTDKAVAANDDHYE